MALNIKNVEVEALAAEIAELTGETKTEAVKRALEERKNRLAYQIQSEDKETRLTRWLETEVWPNIPDGVLGKEVTKDEIEDICGYGSEGE